MAGAKFEIDFNHTEISARIGAAIQGLEHPGPLFQVVIEYLHRIHKARFRQQVSPDGTPWQALSPRYRARKHKNVNKILTFRGYLSGTLRGQFDDTGLEFGTDKPYGAIHQFGGEIKKQASSKEVYFHQTRDGEVRNRFVKKAKSNFAQTVNVAAHVIKIPARPWLGTNEQQNEQILKRTQNYLEKALRS